MMKSDRQLTTIQLDLFVCFYFHTWDILPYHPNTFREISFQFQPMKAEVLLEGPIIGIDLDNLINSCQNTQLSEIDNRQQKYFPDR